MKSDRQYRDAALGAFIGWIGILLFCLMAVLFTGCYGTYYLTDAEYSDVRESHASVTYYDNQIYWGWNGGYYYYYGIPHYYPWYHYYNTCPPSHYHASSHVAITSTVNKPRSNWNRPTHRPNKGNKTNVRVNTNRTNVKTNTNKNKTNVTVKPNRNNKNKVTNRKRPK
tara:strand:- start:878 stop:1381 length:504 start_codon:yes stop_codon:yes gene_type:complete